MAKKLTAILVARMKGVEVVIDFVVEEKGDARDEEAPKIEDGDILYTSDRLVPRHPLQAQAVSGKLQREVEEWAAVLCCDYW